MKDTSPLAVTPPRNHWAGAWIWLPGSSDNRNIYAHFRREFTLDAVTALRMSITADSFYSLYVDGVFIGRGPSRAHLDYYSFDVYDLRLPPGRHSLAVLAHHIGEQNACIMTGRAGLLVDVAVDGIPSQELSSGAHWRCLRSDAYRQDLPCTMSHFGFWEDCDLGRFPDGWDCPGYDDGHWAQAAVIGRPPCAPWSRLCPPDIPAPRRTAVAPVSVTGPGQWQAGAVDPILAKTVVARSRTANPAPQVLPLRLRADATGGQWILVDFGRTVSGDIVLEIGANQAGQTIQVSYDDMLQAGCVNPERSYAHFSDQYILPGKPCTVRTFRPRGFRYAMIDVDGAGECEIRAVAAVEEIYPFPARMPFTCSDAALEEYHRKSALTVSICSTDSFTDCATRERVQWMEDLYMHSHVAAYAFGDTRLMRRALFQAAQNALPDGRINGFMPSERTNCAFASSSIVWLHLLADYYLYNGDENAKRLLPVAQRLLAMIDGQMDEDGLIQSWPAGQFWDWAPIEGQGALLLTNAMFIRALRHLAESGLVHDMRAELLDRADRAAAAAHARFWDARRGLYRDANPADGLPPIYSQHANTAAVLAGVCPPEQRQALLRRLIDPNELGPIPLGEESLSEHNRRTDGRLIPVGTLWFAHFVCQALFENGMDRQALDQMRLFWGAHDALPTMPETRRPHGNIFLCHGWAAGPAYLLPAYVLGIRPAAPGWERVTLQPHPGDLDHAAGDLQTPRGLIRVQWERNPSGQIVLNAELPDGVAMKCGRTCGTERGATQQFDEV